MKIGNFVAFYRNPDAAHATAAPELSSPKLIELREKRKAAWKAMIAVEDGESQAAIDAKMELWKIDGEINAEKQALVKAEQDAKIQQLRNERLALNVTMLDAYKALITAPKNTPADKLAELQTAFDSAKETVDNELLAKYAASSSGRKAAAKTSDDGSEDAKTSGKAERDAKLWPLFAAGKTAKQVQDETGENRSNVWFSLDRYRKAQG